MSVISLVPPTPLFGLQNIYMNYSPKIYCFCLVPARACVPGEGRSHPLSPCPQPLSQGPELAGAAGDSCPAGPGRGRDTRALGRRILRWSFHMVGFAINFECLCGSIKFPMVVYREYERRKLVEKQGNGQLSDTHTKVREQRQGGAISSHNYS